MESAILRSKDAVATTRSMETTALRLARTSAPIEECVPQTVRAVAKSVTEVEIVRRFSCAPTSARIAETARTESASASAVMEHTILPENSAPVAFYRLLRWWRLAVIDCAPTIVTVTDVVTVLLASVPATTVGSAKLVLRRNAPKIVLDAGTAPPTAHAHAFRASPATHAHQRRARTIVLETELVTTVAVIATMAGWVWTVRSRNAPLIAITTANVTLSPARATASRPTTVTPARTN